MKIGLLGGTFDPPHLGHLIAAIQMQERMKFDELWLMPVASHAFGKNLSPSHHRIAMTTLLENGPLLASDFEITLGGLSSTHHTIRALKKTFPEDSFTFCMGSDLIHDFPLWNDWRALLRENPFVIFPRGASPSDMREEAARILGEEYVQNITFIEGKDIIVTNISSTLVRRRVRDRLDISHLVTPPILSYINKHTLYPPYDKTA